MPASLPQSRHEFVEPLEKREMLAVSPVVAGTKIKGINLSSGGVSTNQTLITVPFTDNIVLSNVGLIRMFGYALNPESANATAQVKTTVHAVSAQVIDSDENNDGVQEHKYLQITTDRLMRKNGTIIFNEGSLTDANGDVLATQTRKTVKGQNKERFTLACRAFRPGGVALAKMSNAIFDASPTPTTASTAPADATVQANLDNFLGKKVTLGVISQAQKDAAMTRYASASGIFPDANLRAALISLTGTFAEPAIASYLDGANLTAKPYTIVTFANPDDSTVPVAQTSVRATDGRLRTIFKTEFRGEPFQALSAWLAHEAIHQDTSIGLQEEIAATVVETLIYAQQAQTDAAFMNAGTKLTALENEKAFALINSGRAIFPYVGLSNGPIIGAGAGVFPGQKAPADGGGVYTSFENFVKRAYLSRGAVSQSTATNPLWLAYYKNITGKDAPANQAFGDALIADIDSFQATVSTRQAIQLAREFRAKLS
jgi:hypothetical protein